MTLNLKNTEGTVLQRKLGFSWTVFFFQFWPMLFRKDWKWASISFVVWLAPVIGWIRYLTLFLYTMPEIDWLDPNGVDPYFLMDTIYEVLSNSDIMLSVNIAMLLSVVALAYFLFKAVTYNKRELRKLQRRGFEPTTEGDRQMLASKWEQPELEDGQSFLYHVKFSRAKGIVAALLFFVGVHVISLLVFFVAGMMGTSDFYAIASWSQFIASGSLTVIFLFMFGLHFKEEWLKITSKGKFFGGIILGWISLFMLNLVTGTIVQMIYPTYEAALNQQAVQHMVTTSPVLSFFFIVIFAIVTEEVVFRLIMMKWLERWPWLGILVSSTVFGFVHVMWGGDWHFIITYAGMGIPMAYSYYKTRNIWYPVGIHFLQNLFAYIMLIAFF